jgi:hypothetical protein
LYGVRATLQVVAVERRREDRRGVFLMGPQIGLGVVGRSSKLWEKLYAANRLTNSHHVFSAIPNEKGRFNPLFSYDTVSGA